MKVSNYGIFLLSITCAKRVVRRDAHSGNTIDMAGFFASEGNADLLNHGCWCVRFNNPGTFDGFVVDSIDALCRQWYTKRTCKENVGECSIASGYQHGQYFGNIHGVDQGCISINEQGTTDFGDLKRKKRDSDDYDYNQYHDESGYQIEQGGQ